MIGLLVTLSLCKMHDSATDSCTKRTTSAGGISGCGTDDDARRVGVALRLTDRQSVWLVVVNLAVDSASR